MTDLQLDHHACQSGVSLTRWRLGKTSTGVGNSCCSRRLRPRGEAADWLHGGDGHFTCRVLEENVSFGSELPSQTEQRPGSALRAGRGVAAETGVSEIILETVRMVLRGRELREVPDHGIDITFDDGVLAICRVCRMSWGVGRRQFTTAAWWSCPRGCSRTQPSLASHHAPNTAKRPA
jgi:hypothetical protein